MGQVVGELRQPLHTAVDAVEHHIHAAGQVTELLRQSRFRQAQRQLLGRHLLGDPTKPAQWRQAALHQFPGDKADQQQQQGQGPQRRAQVGLQQAVVIGAIDGEQHPHFGAVLQTHQARGGEQLIVVAVLPLAEGQVLVAVDAQQPVSLKPRPQGQQS
ncbi:hypothetical protein D3C80_1547270 [compost metagenome]